MSASILSKIKRGVPNLPPRQLVSGQVGIGKTSYGAKFPNPLFLAPESGLTGLPEHIGHLSPEKYEDVRDLVDQLTIDPSGYQSLIIDTSDALDRSIYDYIVRREGSSKVKTIEDVGGGWQKGYYAAAAELSLILNKLDRLRESQQMHIVILSHVEIKTFTSPESQVWDRYQLKGHKFMSSLWSEWPDACLFATYEIHQIKEGRKEKTVEGDRVVHTQWSPAWEAKNRLGLPETISFDYDEIEKAIFENSSPELRKNFMSLLSTSTLTEDQRKLWTKVPVENLPSDRIKSGIAKLEKLQSK